MTLCPHCGTPNAAGVRFCDACGATLGEARPDPLIGRTVGGAYLLQELIGVGGMGRVYLAEQNMLGRTVAVKVIHPHLLGDDQTVARFYNEARAASRLNHPASVGIIDFGRTEDGILYLVMEHLAGRDLAHVLADEGPLTFARVCRIVRAVLSALGEAHALGVVHRDLKPENIILRKVRRGAEQVKVVDFGLAHIVGPGGTSITTPGLVCGTPDYMSPEQGRGETVDGRGDLYSVGVVLFELLTDRLPYEDDTPTKVVYRHIHDPIPDPRDIAPQRQIPDALAEICLRALRKRADDRYQSADEFFEALTAVERTISAPKGPERPPCGTCGASNPPDQSYCGTCGARLTGRFSMPPTTSASQRPATQSRPATVPALDAPLVGRSAELERLRDLFEVSDRASVCVRLIGEAGAGKSRLLAEVAMALAGAGEVVVRAGPHASGAAVPYWTAQVLLRGLLGLEPPHAEAMGRVPSMIDRVAAGDPIARAGLAEILTPEGLPGRPGVSRSEAVAVALRAAARVASARSRSGRVALLVDDLQRCDVPSADAIRALGANASGGPLFLMTAEPAGGRPAADAEAITMHLRGLELEDAMRLLEGAEDPPPGEGLDRDKETIPTGRLHLPLYLEQLRALGVTNLDGGDEAVPPRLADAVLVRLERLALAQRRLLQSIAVLGESAPMTVVESFARTQDLPALGPLFETGLIRAIGADVVIAHPFVRELVESSIPAELRKELHAAALELAAQLGEPLEVRADHAWRAGEPMSALLLLERMGDAAVRRGDASGGVMAFRRGLELARRELLLTGETTLDRAVVTFSRKLGDALDRLGDVTGADGVLREALELAGPSSRERPRMLLLLSRVAVRRGRARDATRLLGQALELCLDQGDKQGEAEAHVALGLLRLEDGDALTAANTLQKALDLAPSLKDNGVVRVDATMARGRALLAVGDHRGAATLLERGRGAAEALGKARLADLVHLLAEVHAAAGETSQATSVHREAVRLAADAGDVSGARRPVPRGSVPAKGRE